MTHCCDDMDSGFHFLRVSALPDAACGNGGSSKSGVQMEDLSQSEVGREGEESSEEGGALDVIHIGSTIATRLEVCVSDRHVIVTDYIC